MGGIFHRSPGPLGMDGPEGLSSWRRAFLWPSSIAPCMKLCGYVSCAQLSSGSSCWYIHVPEDRIGSPAKAPTTGVLACRKSCRPYYQKTSSHRVIAIAARNTTHAKLLNPKPKPYPGPATPKPLLYGSEPYCFEVSCMANEPFLVLVW